MLQLKIKGTGQALQNELDLDGQKSAPLLKIRL